MPLLPCRDLVFWFSLSDFLALEAFWTWELRRSIYRVVWASPDRPFAKALLDALYGPLDHVVLWKKWRDFPRFSDFGHVSEVTGYRETMTSLVPSWNPDWPFVGSSLRKAPRTAPERLNLPDAYSVVAGSGNDLELTQAEWRWVEAALASLGQVGVVLSGTAPASEWFLPLGPCSIYETVQVIGRSSGFQGVASWESVAFSKLHDGAFVVKGSEINSEFWYAPMPGRVLVRETLDGSAR